MRRAIFTETGFAKATALYSGLVFGIYWIPLRAISEAGFPQIWASVAFNGTAFAVVLPLFVLHIGVLARAGLRFHLGGLLAGAALAFYATAFMYTEVVRTILLFYLTPIWGFLVARYVMGDRITPIRWAAIALGLAGMLVIFGKEAGLPLPQKLGDWIALLAGIVWAFASTLLLTDRKHGFYSYALTFFFWGAAIPLAIALVATSVGGLAPADWSAFAGVAPWLFPIALVIIVPAGFATIYGPTKLNPGVVGLLFMAEISVVTVTAALIADEPFGWREAAGILLISSAGLLEPFQDLRRVVIARPS